jgi:CBS domain-containing protein
VTAASIADPNGQAPGAPTVAPSASLRDALAALLLAGADTASVIGDNGAVIGTVTLAAIRERARPDSNAPAQ